MLLSEGLKSLKAGCLLSDQGQTGGGLEGVGTGKALRVSPKTQHPLQVSSHHPVPTLTGASRSQASITEVAAERLWAQTHTVHVWVSETGPWQPGFRRRAFFQLKNPGTLPQRHCLLSGLPLPPGPHIQPFQSILCCLIPPRSVTSPASYTCVLGATHKTPHTLVLCSVLKVCLHLMKLSLKK